MVPPWAINDGTAEVLPLGVFIPILWSSISLAVAVNASSPEVVEPAYQETQRLRISNQLTPDFDSSTELPYNWKKLFNNT